MAEDPNRRGNRRFRVEAYASLESTGPLSPNDQAFGTVLDVSRTGIRVCTGQPPEEGQWVVLRVAIEDEIHDLRAVVMRTTKLEGEDLYDVGLEFSGSTAEQLALLEHFARAINQR